MSMPGFDFNTQQEEPAFAGKTVAWIVRGADSSGYGYVRIEFTDGSVIRVREEGQAGCISWDAELSSTPAPLLSVPQAGSPTRMQQECSGCHDPMCHKYLGPDHTHTLCESKVDAYLRSNGVHVLPIVETNTRYEADVQRAVDKAMADRSLEQDDTVYPDLEHTQPIPLVPTYNTWEQVLSRLRRVERDMDEFLAKYQRSQQEG